MAATLPRVRSCLLLMTFMVGSAGCEGKPAPAAAMPAEVTVCQPLQRQITDAVEYTGTTSAPESADVRARVTGFLEKVLFEPRARVNAGDPIFEIDARPFKAALERAEADVKANEAQLVKAEFDAERIIELQEKGVASPSEFTKEIANRDMVRASLAASKAIAEQAALEYSWCKVTAPITGRISRNYIDTGNIVTADQTVLARITNDDSLFAYFNCSERDVLTLREWARKEYVGDGGSPTSMPEIRQVKWPMYLGLMTEEGFPHVGVMDYTSPEVDASTGTLQVRGVFPNSNNILIPGLFVRLRLPIGKPYPATVVPERVLGSDQGQRYLFVVNAKNVVEYRPVAVGTLDAGLRVITQGISDSDWVIVSGMQRVRPGASVNAQRVPMESVLKPGTAGTAATTQTAERIESRGDTQL